MLTLPEVIGADWVDKGGGKDLGDVGAVAGVGVWAGLLLVEVFGRSMAAGERTISMPSRCNWDTSEGRLGCSWSSVRLMRD